jgi:hypothetical protein
MSSEVLTAALSAVRPPKSTEEDESSGKSSVWRSAKRLEIDP